MTVDFKFETKQKVKTVLGDVGVIDTAATNDGKDRRYYIKLKDGKGSWFDEDQLEVAE